MNQIVGKQANGRDYVALVLEPGNLHRLQKKQPITVRIEDLFPAGIPRKLTVLISFSATPQADAKRLRETAEVTFDERTPVSEKKRPHCPECRSTVETLGVWRNDSPLWLVFCPVCGCTLGIVPKEKEPAWKAELSKAEPVRSDESKEVLDEVVDPPHAQRDEQNHK
jgi:hypothetical protein